jgi:hypothetical protein
MENCPSCGEAEFVRPKLLLIDEAWVCEPGKDPRLAYAASLRVDDLKEGAVQASPLEQFVQGHYCDKCGRGFVADEWLNPNHRQYR